MQDSGARFAEDTMFVLVRVKAGSSCLGDIYKDLIGGKSALPEDLGYEGGTVQVLPKSGEGV